LRNSLGSEKDDGQKINGKLELRILCPLVKCFSGGRENLQQDFVDLQLTMQWLARKVKGNKESS